MQVNYIIEFLLFQFVISSTQIFVKNMYFVDIWI